MTSFNWKYAVGELVLIISGILIAFTLNAWWEGQKDALREQAYLEQMLADVQDYEERLEASIKHDRQMQKGAEKLLNVIHTELA